MSKTFSSELADEIGYTNATHISAMSSDLLEYTARVNAERKAKGLPTLEEEEAQMMEILIEALDAGEYEQDPELKQIAMEAKAERDAAAARSGDTSKRG